MGIDLPVEPPTPSNREDSPAPSNAESIPNKSRSLRAGSVQKRIQTELKLKMPRSKSGSTRASRMTKYRRKTANAKERDRMKKVNLAFDRLRGVIPDVKTLTKEEKDTKVTTLRAAISYINGLQELLLDLDTGKVDPSAYQHDDISEEDENILRKVTGTHKSKQRVVGKKKIGKSSGTSKPGGLREIIATDVTTKPSKEARTGPVTLSMKADMVYTHLLHTATNPSNKPNPTVHLSTEESGQDLAAVPARPTAPIQPRSMRPNSVMLMAGVQNISPGHHLLAARTNNTGSSLNLLSLEPLPLTTLFPNKANGSSNQEKFGSDSSYSSASYLKVDQSPLQSGKPGFGAPSPNHIWPKVNLRKQQQANDFGSSVVLSSDLFLSHLNSTGQMTDVWATDSSEKSDSLAGDNPESPDSLINDVEMGDNMSDSDMMSDSETGSLISIPDSPTNIIPTIDQLFKRSFSYELEELAKSCGGEEPFIIIDELVNTSSGEHLIILDDIHSIIREHSDNKIFSN